MVDCPDTVPDYNFYRPERQSFHPVILKTLKRQCLLAVAAVRPDYVPTAKFNRPGLIFYRHWDGVNFEPCILGSGTQSNEKSQVSNVCANSH